MAAFEHGALSEAAEAFGQAVRLAPETVEYILHHGVALTRDPSMPLARYYAGLLMAQDARRDEAIAIWERLRAETPTDAPWLEFLDGMLAEAKARRDGTPGPSAADIEAAGAMSPEERQAMIAFAGSAAMIKGFMPNQQIIDNLKNLIESWT